ncbi:MAG TPA: glycine cleavage T C-terminal barrel domain-containing protein [Pleomorphomonadaceae bacterium]|nr:glycine cleavage T C-terminal barrel domain-containing protein [Pleomorphomonadaceae bacterium]
MRSSPGHFLLDGVSLAYEPGDTLAMAVVRAGAHPGRGGTLCLAGDCGNCVAEVDGIAYVRTCQTTAGPSLTVRRHPQGGPPAWHDPAPSTARPQVRRMEADVVVVGGGTSGRGAATAAQQAGRHVVLLDAGDGNEVVAVYAGPTLVARTREGMLHVRAQEVVVATGAAEIQPACPGNQLAGLVTARAARELHEAGIDLGDAVAIGPPPDGVPCMLLTGELVRIEGKERVSGVVTLDGGVERTTPCDTLILNLGRSPRDVLARMADDLPVRVVGSSAEAFPLPPAPTTGIVCPCVGIGVDDLEGVWSRGFRELELVKRASLVGTGTCQGSVCLPHVRAWIAARTGEAPGPFTARPASRQITLGEAAEDVHLDAFRRTPLHDEHVALGAQMDRFGGWWRPWHYGDHLAEYRAVRAAVSLGDVSTLGKFLVDGPDAVEFLQRLYPTDVATIRPGRSRYALLLNERGHVIDDGMICRESESRFVLTFTTGGAGNAEMWMRDWIETWGLHVLLLDRTMSLAAINVTGPRAAELLARVGLAYPPRFLQHTRVALAGMACHVMRLSFTGEASFEIHHPVDRSVGLWRGLLAAGDDLGIRPHGLQALFGLRLEKGHVIIGMDTELDTTPRRLGMDWAVDMDKPDFLGRDALARTASLPDQRRLVGLTMPGTAPTEGSPISSDGDIVGHVTSSFASPTLGQAVMLGWLKRAPFPDRFEIDERLAAVTPPPFYDPEGQRARA